MVNIDFSVDMHRIDHWAYKMGVDLRDSVQLLEPYVLAQHYILQLVDRLIKFHDFHPIDSDDRRILFSIVHATPDDRSTPRLVPPNRVIELPLHASSFFSPDRQQQWEQVFHGNNKLWFNRCRRVPGAKTAVDLLHLLQCLLPGMFILVEIQDTWSTQRGIPPLSWVLEHKGVLVACVGDARYASLCKAAEDVKNAVIDSRDISIGAKRSS